MTSLAVISVALALLVYAFMPIVFKSEFVSKSRGNVKIIYMIIIIVLTVIDAEVLSIGKVALTMRSSVLLLAGIELIDTIEEQIKIYKTDK